MPPVAEGRQPSPFFVDDIVAKSEVIVVGQVGAAADVGPGTAVFPGRGPKPLEGRILSAEVKVSHWIKGAAKSRVLRLHYIRFDRLVAPTPGYRELLCVLFLRAVGDHYELVDVTRPNVPAAEATPEGDSPLERVASAVAGVVSPGAIRSWLTLGTLSALGGISTESARRALTSMMRSPDRFLQLDAVGRLALRGDRVALEFATDALERPGSLSTVEAGMLRNHVANGWLPEDAYPMIRRLLRSKRVENRLAAVRALGNGSSPAAIPLLAEALSDRDADVRWHSMVQLAGIAGTTVRVAGNGSPKQQEAEERYWKNWVSERGLGR